MKMSVTITSLIVLVAGLLGVGDVFPKDEVSTVVNAVVQIVGVVGIWVGRYRQGDINVFGVKK